MKREERGVLTVLRSWGDSNWLLGKRLRVALRHLGILPKSHFDILVHGRPVDHRYPPGMEERPQDVNDACEVKREDDGMRLENAIGRQWS